MAIDIEILEDRASETPSDRGFIKVRRLRLRTHAEGGEASAPFPYDVADRAAIDAVVVLMHAENADDPGDPVVCVRAQLRPPLLLRRGRSLAVPDPSASLSLWELPAGLIEPHEQGEAGVVACAARETEEETGFALPAEAFARLGAPVFLSPGLMAEKIHAFSVRVPDHRAEVVALGDGALEQGAAVQWLPLSECLRRCADGRIEDAKTELVLRRFRDALAAAGR